MRHFTDALFEEFEVAFEVGDLQEIADKIKVEVDAHENDGPYGNQNCMLCTWAVELQLRGMSVYLLCEITKMTRLLRRSSYEHVF